MKQPSLMIKSILLIVGCFSFIQSFSQASWEVDMLRSINHNPPSSDFWKGISSTTKPLAIAAPLGMAAVALFNKDKQLAQKAYEVAGSLVIATITAQGLKVIVNRPRPYATYTGIYPDVVETDKSFPSGHVSTAFSTAASVSIQCKKWYVTVPLYAWATGVGYSRMYLGQHYPSDVIAGAAVGIGSAYLAHWLNQKFFQKKK
ncbi:MAG: phosphatase PAP2 family protein [Sediminibacterium magnilacihabitans]|jgi:membrane-associated phospholipid phosphatase|nr:phosphatase PAP2 family protein [Sediminibacterium magnilacihabitans]